MNDKIPTIDECKYHLQTLCKYELSLQEQSYEKFIKPVFETLEKYKLALLKIAYEEILQPPNGYTEKQFLVEIAENALEE
ncbi:MAG: hypothetical protein Q8898_09745 [Bacillota bacterium]|nr:hypothetical protein [Bacillota bacterium]